MGQKVYNSERMKFVEKPLVNQRNERIGRLDWTKSNSKSDSGSDQDSESDSESYSNWESGAIPDSDPDSDWIDSGNEQSGSHFVEKPMENQRNRKLGKWTPGGAFRWKTNGKSTKLQVQNPTTGVEFRWKTVSKSTKWAKPPMSEMCWISLKNR